MNKKQVDTKILAEVAITIALSTALSTFKIFSMPFGGSVTLGSMVPLFILAFRRGPVVGITAGTIHGMIQLMFQPYILTPVQFLLDYPLPWACIGLAGYFKDKPMIGVGVGITGRFISHYVSGVVFWYMYAERWAPVIYSAVYNGLYLVPELIISAVLVYFLLKRGILENNL